MLAGVNAYTLIEALFKTFAKFMNIKGSAFETIKNYIKPDDDIDFSVSLPSTYFKLGKVLNVDDASKIINIEIMNSPIGNCSDGVAVNQKAVRLLHTLYGINAINFRCSAHASDRTLKRIARSETMCVEQVKSLYLCLNLLENIPPTVAKVKKSWIGKWQC